VQPGQPSTPPQESDLPTNPGTTGPKLTTRSATLDKNGRFNISVRCTDGGSFVVTALRLGVRPIATGAYKCVGGKARPILRLNRKQAGKVGNGMQVTVAFQGGSTGTFVLRRARGIATKSDAGYWGDGYGLCGPGGSHYLHSVMPNLASGTRGSYTYYIKPWVQYWSKSTGWRWQGFSGENNSPFMKRTATPTGTAEYYSSEPGIGGSVSRLDRWSWDQGFKFGLDVYAIAAVEVWTPVNGKWSYSFNYLRSTGMVAADASAYCFFD
jgi:hypothetical protein